MASRNSKEATTTTASAASFTIDMIHSENEVLHGLQHLIGYDDETGAPMVLEGHETMLLYRNVRKKYSSVPASINDGVRSMTTFRTAEEGLKASYRSGLCRKGAEREASALYVCINPRSVVRAMALTQDNYLQWMEWQAGLTKVQPKGTHQPNYVGTLDKKLVGNIMRKQSRKRLDVIDVDDKTWLPRIRSAIGDANIELIVETKNGYHVIFCPKRMVRHEHEALQAVLAQSPRGKEEKASRVKGEGVACALPGGSQSYHQAKIVYCSCQRRPPITSATECTVASSGTTHSS